MAVIRKTRRQSPKPTSGQQSSCAQRIQDFPPRGCLTGRVSSCGTYLDGYAYRRAAFGSAAEISAARERILSSMPIN